MVISQKSVRDDEENEIGSSETIDKEAQLSKRLFDKYNNDKRQIWAKNVRDDDDYVHNSHWTSEEQTVLALRGQPALSIPITYQAVDQAVSMLTAHAPRYIAQPVETSDSTVAVDISDLFEYNWNYNRGNVHFKQIAKDYYAKSMGVMIVYFNPSKDAGKGEICFNSSDCLDWYIDPASKERSGQDASHIIGRSIKTQRQIKNWVPDYYDKIISTGKMSSDDYYPTSERTSNEGQIANVTDTQQNNYVVLDRYTKVKIKYFRINDSTDGEENLYSEAEFKEYVNQPAMIERRSGQNPIYHSNIVQELKQVYEMTGGVYHQVVKMNPQTGERAIEPVTGYPQPNEDTDLVKVIPNSTTVLEVITIQKLIDEGQIYVSTFINDRIQRVLTVGDVTIYNDILPTAFYPIILFPNGFRRNPYPMSDIRYIRPLQDALNKTESLIIAHVTRNTSPKLKVPKGSGNKKEIEEEWGKPGLGVIEVNETEHGRIEVIQLQQLANGLYQRKNELKNEIYETLGIYPFSQGNPENAPDTKGATLLLEANSSRRINSKLVDLEESLNIMGKVVFDFIQAYYSPEKILRILAPNNKKRVQKEQMDEKQFLDLQVRRIKNILTGAYDIVVKSGSTLPSNREAKREQYINLYQMGFPVEEQILENSDIKEPELIIERMDKIKQLEQALGQAQEQIKGLKGDLQTANRAEVSARKRLEVNDFSTTMKDISNRADKGEQLFTQTLNMEAKNAKQKGKATKELVSN